MSHATPTSTALTSLAWSPDGASLAAGGRSSATLEVVTGTPLLTVRVASLGGTSGTLLRASTPAGSPSQVTLSWGDGQDRSGEKDVAVLSASSGTAAVTVTLNQAVSWRLGFAGGTMRTVADLRGGTVAAVTFTAGSDTITLNASDSFGNAATAATIAVTVNGAPSIAAPASETIGVDQAATIAGVSLSESGNVSGETITVGPAPSARSSAVATK